MKLARISSLLFVPLAFCASVPQQIEIYEINENNVNIVEFSSTTYANTN